MRKQAANAVLAVAVACMFIFATTGGVTADPVKGDPDDPGNWNEIETEHFVFHYPADGDYEGEAQRTADRTEQLYKELVGEVPDDGSYYSFSQKIHVYMHPPSDWPRNKRSLVWYDTDPIVINFAAPESSGVGLDGHSRGIAHEIANILLWDSANRYEDYNYYQRNPSWFGEGLSEYYVYSTPTVESIVSYNDTHKGGQRLSDIREGGATWTVMTGYQYSGGYYLTTYLIDEYGEDAVWQILKDDSETFKQAIEASLGDSYEEVKNGWYQWIEAEYGVDYSSYYTESALEKELANARERIDQLESRLEQRNKTIEELRTELSTKEAEIEDLESEENAESKGGSNTENTTRSSADESGPGFGLVAAVIALVSLLGIAAKRR